MCASPAASRCSDRAAAARLPSYKVVRLRVMLRALRLMLVQADLAILEATIEGSGALSVVLGGCANAKGWEVFP